jgi:hypothetical protein
LAGVLLLKLVLNDYFREVITVKIRNSKRSGSFDKKAVATAVVVIGFTTLGTAQAKALDLKNLLGDVSTVLNVIQSIADNFHRCCLQSLSSMLALKTQL